MCQIAKYLAFDTFGTSAVSALTIVNHGSTFMLGLENGEREGKDQKKRNERKSCHFFDLDANKGEKKNVDTQFARPLFSYLPNLGGIEWKREVIKF